MNIMANGISQAAPLLSATPGNFMEKIMGGIVPISQTSLSPYMMTFLVLELLLLPVIYYLLMPKKEKAVEISDELYKEFTAEPEKIDASKKLTPAERWERSRVLNTLIALLILIWFGDHVITEGVSKINLNTINFALFGLGLLFHDSPHSYIESVKEGATTVYGVIIQFPLYAGIFGLITFSGLADEITELFISIATQGPIRGSYSFTPALWTSSSRRQGLNSSSKRRTWFRRLSTWAFPFRRLSTPTARARRWPT